MNFYRKLNNLRLTHWDMLKNIKLHPHSLMVIIKKNLSFQLQIKVISL